MRLVPAASLVLLLLTGPVAVRADDAPAEVAPKPSDPPLLNPDHPDGQQVIRISNETTRLTEPLTEDGFVDYVEALNQRDSKGVTPENNFEVVLRRTVGSREIDEELRPEYYRRLGIDALPDDGAYYRSVHEFVGYEEMSPADRATFDAAYDAALNGPWRAADHPRIAEWLTSENEHLDELVEGSRRSRNYTPLVVPPGDDAKFAPAVAAVIPTVQAYRECARGLTIRATRRIGDGDVDAARTDVRATHRIARHVDTGGTIIEGLVAIAIDAVAFQADEQLLRSPATTPEQLRRILADLNSLPNLEPMAEKIDRYERLVGLDATQSFARHGLEETRQLDVDGNAWARMIAGMVANMAENGRTPFSPDWNATMKVLNGYYDRLADAIGEDDVARRDEKLDALDVELKGLHEMARRPTKLLGRLFTTGKPRKVVGEVIGQVLVAMLLPAVQQVRVAESRGHAKLAVMRIAYALRVREADEGDYPESLVALVPKYLNSIPLDPHTGEPLVYRPSAKGFVVYSLGRNRRDDHGKGHDDRAEDDIESDDIGVRYEAKPRPARR